MYFAHGKEAGLEMMTGLIPQRVGSRGHLPGYPPGAGPRHSQCHIHSQYSSYYQETALLTSWRRLVTLTILVPTQPQEFIPGSCRVRPGATHCGERPVGVQASRPGGDKLHAAQGNAGPAQAGQTLPQRLLWPALPYEPVHKIIWGFTGVREQCSIQAPPVMPGHNGMATLRACCWFLVNISVFVSIPSITI